MSPQSRAAISNTTIFATSRNADDGWSTAGNPCSGATSSVAEIARAANMEYALHKIESESSTPCNPLVDDYCGAPHRKRSSSCISSSTSKNEHQPFLSSYGSAFLSGIFADIAHASPDEEQNGHSATASHQENCAMELTTTDAANNEPCLKKARTTASNSFGRQPKSCRALAGLTEGAISEVSSPSVVSPRLNTSADVTLKIQLPFNDQVRELQDMAFPSLPQIPVTVSSSSCSTASSKSTSATPRENDDALVGNMNGDQDQSESYGWFVNMDEDEAEDQSGVASMFLPDTKPEDLAFNAITAPSAGNQDLEVQQALAADTIDDVLGDLF